MLIYTVQVVLHYIHSKPSLFATVTFLQNPANDKLSMHEVKTLWRSGVGEIKVTRGLMTSNLISNKHKNIFCGVYWNDISVPA
jgi:hypothetical protein